MKPERDKTSIKTFSYLFHIIERNRILGRIDKIFANKAMCLIYNI